MIYLIVIELRPPKDPLGIVGVPSEEFMYQYILGIPNTTYFGVTFNNAQNVIQYQIWYNYTLTRNRTRDGLFDPFNTQILSLMKGLDEAIIWVIGADSWGPDVEIDVTVKDWPEIPSAGLSNRVITQFGKVFFFCSPIFVFMSGINQIMMEKEKKLRIAMEYMGLQRTVYWISWFITHSIMIAINTLSVYLFGLMFQFLTFKNTNASLYTYSSSDSSNLSLSLLSF